MQSLSVTVLNAIIKAFFEYSVSLPLIGVDHILVEVGVFLDDAQWDHICNVPVCVPQLVEFQVDSEHVFPDSV